MPRLDAEILARLEEALGRAAERACPDLPANLLEAINYSLLSGGKRLRPLLCMRAAEAVGAGAEAAVPAACAIEMVHAFSLVHDDLPAMDDDDLRRGRPTCHVKYGEAMAILSGDALATLPYALLEREVADRALAARLIAELAQATALMIAGQVFDTLGGLPEGMAAAERVELIHRNKTGALLRAACRMGGLCGGGDGRAIGALTEYGESVGLMFQIVDDLLDVTQTAEELGKRAQKDAQAGKVTYPAVFGIEKCRGMVEALRKSAVESVRPFGESGTALAMLADRMAQRRK